MGLAEDSRIKTMNGAIPLLHTTSEVMVVERISSAL